MNPQDQTQTESREHRAQTNVGVLTGVISRAAQLKVAANTKTGEVYATDEKTGKALQIAECTVRVDDPNGGDSQFFDVEAAGALALNLFRVKRGATVQLAGRYESWTNKKGNDEAAVYYVNDKFKVIDRSFKSDGTPNPEAIAPITVIAEGVTVRHGLSILIYGTISGKGTTPVALSGGRTKMTCAVANNTSKPGKPSWFDVGAYGDAGRDLMSLEPKSLVKIGGKIRKFVVNGRRRVELVAKTIELIAAPKNGPTAANFVGDADDLADALMEHFAGGGYTPSPAANAPIDVEDPGVLQSQIDDADVIAAETEAPKRRRARRGAEQTEEPIAA